MNQPSSPQTQECQHHWIVIEYTSGKRVFQDNSMYKDWTSNIINSHYLRATKIYCTECGVQRTIPGDESDE